MTGPQVLVHQERMRIDPAKGFLHHLGLDRPLGPVFQQIRSHLGRLEVRHDDVIFPLQTLVPAYHEENSKKMIIPKEREFLQVMH